MKANTALMVRDETTALALKDNADLWTGGGVDILPVPAEGGKLPDDQAAVVVDWDDGESETTITAWLLFRVNRPRIVILTSYRDREPLDATRRPLAALVRQFPETVRVIEKPFGLNDLRKAVKA